MDHQPIKMPSFRESSIWYEPIIEPNPEIAVFHDESGDYNKGEWVLTGLFWIRQSDIKSLVAQLQLIREDYVGELHFNKFPKSFNGEYGTRPRIARDWFNLWQGEWSRYNPTNR